LLHRETRSSELWIERWSSAHRGGGGKEEIQFSRYWYCKHPFYPSSRLKLPLGSDWPSGLRNFARGWRETLQKSSSSEWVKLKDANNNLPDDLPPPDRIVVTVSPPMGHDRQLPFYPFHSPLRDAVVLEKPLRRLLLEACGTPRSAGQVAQIMGHVDEQSVRGELIWTARYEDRTLRQAAFFTAIRRDGQDQLSATLRLPSFLADPLLSALTPLSLRGKPTGRLGQSPQRTEGLPLAELRKQKLVGTEMLATSVGDYPLPVPAEIERTRAAAKPAPRLAQEKWRILQWLDIESRCQVNLRPTDQQRRVLAWQRLALLHFDCVVLLTKEMADPAVSSLVAEARKRFERSVAGTLEPTTLLRSRDLPRDLPN
jgi:hypothetical protein